MTGLSRPGRIRLIVILSLVLALELACRGGWVDPVAVIAPSQMLAGSWNLLLSGRYFKPIGLTLSNVAMAGVMAVTVGFLMGWVLFKLPRFRRAVDPLLASYYAVPTFIFYPLFIVMFGLNRWPLVAIGFIFAVVAGAVPGMAPMASTTVRRPWRWKTSAPNLSVPMTPCTYIYIDV